MNRSVQPLKVVGRRLRDVLFRCVTAVERLRPGGNGLMPPAHLRRLYYRSFSRAAYLRECERGRVEILSHGLAPDDTLLDLGSGIGNLAIGLQDYLTGTYDGLDVHGEAVDWCRAAITSRHPAYRFHRADVASRAYNRSGRLPGERYVFPFEDDSFSFACAASLFTHLLPGTAAQYIRELSRVLKPGGTCVLSFFLVDEEARASLRRAGGFLPFQPLDSSEVCWITNPEVPEAAVALDQAFIVRTAESAGLHVQAIRRGYWWRGLADDQDVVKLMKNGAEKR